MSHPLEQRIAALRRRVRRLVTLYGVSWVLAAVLGAMVVLGLADYVFRFHDRGLRVICSLAVLAAAAWTCYRFLYFALVVRLRDVDLAVRLERRFPAMQDSLLSAVEFLRQAEDDPTAGSPALRRAVIARATAESERLDFSAALDRRRPLRAAMVTATVCLVAAILVVLDPSHSQVAVARLVNPFSDVAYPQSTHLMLRGRVDRIARGQEFKVEVVEAREGIALPADVRIHYRFDNADGTVTSESEPMRPLGRAMVARRDNILRPFSYRVTGGDDHSMPWIAVEVVEPPAVQSLSIRMTPPPYTGWPPEKTDGHIRALVGTRLEIAGQATRPLRAIELCFEAGRTLPGQVSGDGYHFTVPAPSEPPLVVEKSGAYWFRLTDQEGLPGGSDTRWEIRAVADAPPSVIIEQPSANLFVTPGAVVPLRVTVKDDLAIRDVALVFSRADSAQPSDDNPLPLYTGPPRVEPRPSGGLSSGAELGERRVIDYRWQLQQLGLSPGSQVSFYATAGDYRPQAGRSEPRRLVIITPAELQERIAGRQNVILSELERVLKLEREARGQVLSLETRLNEAGQFQQLDLDHLQAAELGQRQVTLSLTSRSDGVPGHILALLADLENNKLDSPDIQRRMQGLFNEIDRLDREHLPLIAHELTAAIKSAQVRLQEAPAAATRPKGSEPPQRDPAVAGALAEAGKHQDAVTASLRQMLGQLGQWDNFRRFYREISQLLREQEDVAARASEVGRRTLGRDLRDLQPQDVADLKILAGRQLELGRQLDRIEQEMQQADAELRTSDPLAAETLSDALAESRRLGIGGQMRTAGTRLEENQIGQAAGQHKQIIQDLQEVLDILANRRQNELARLMKKLREAETDLAEIERQQAGLREQIAEQTRQSDPARQQTELNRLAGPQAELQQETERMARRLERLLADQAARTSREAAGQMGRAAQAAGQGSAQGALGQAEAARKTLEQARRQLADRRFQAQAELAMEQLGRLEDALGHLRTQQQQVLGETQRYRGLEESQGRLSRAQAAGLSDLARQQQLLHADAARLADQLSGAAATHLALAGAARDMDQAAALLAKLQTGPATQQAEQNALRRLGLLLEALKPETPPEKADGAGGGQGGAQQGVQPLAELKLLKLVQQDVNLRTAELQQAVGPAGEPTEQQRQQYVSLAEEQGRLADMVLRLLKPTEEESP